MADESTRDEPQPDTGLAGDLWLAGQNWNEAWQRRQADVPVVVYHYTNATGLLGIVRSKELWASHAAFVNDSSEILYVKRVLDPVRAELKDRYHQALVHAYLEQIDELFHGLVVSRYDVYLACFCEYGDQLSQWRGYPSTGGWYAIGFRTAVIGEGRPMRKPRSWRTPGFVLTRQAERTAKCDVSSRAGSSMITRPSATLHSSGSGSGAS